MLISRTVSGGGAETYGYDAIDRLTAHESDLGAFALGYLGQTNQITSRALANTSLATSWSYLPNLNDRRLAGISNTGLSSGQFSNFTFTTTPENFISAIAETSDTPTVYPASLSQTASYNNLNQLTDLSGQSLSYDAVGNLLSDGQRNYAWDAENRLIGITYPGAPGKQTTFTYDGLDRRVAITSVPAGGGAGVTRSFVWCGAEICQARNAGNAVTRAYFAEGELTPGTPSQQAYYGIDQLGSVRRAFESASSAPAYAYDPYGTALQATAPVTDYGYAGMLIDADSGLYLTQYRAYDPVAGRWISRDPMGEGSDPAANLYAYAGGKPISSLDPSGLGPVGAAWGATIGGGIGAWGGGITFGGAGAVGGTLVFPGAGTLAGGAAGASEGALWGGIGGALAGAWIGSTIEDIYNTMAGSDEPAYPDNPNKAPEKFTRIPGTPAKQCEDGSVWEPDRGGERAHGGPQWKRWPNKRSWDKGKEPQSVWDDTGKVRK